MTNNKDNLKHSSAEAVGASAEAIDLGNDNKAYEKPVLICYGDVRDITLGPTTGTGESGCAAIFRPGPGFPPGGRPPICDL